MLVKRQGNNSRLLGTDEMKFYLTRLISNKFGIKKSDALSVAENCWAIPYLYCVVNALNEKKCITQAWSSTSPDEDKNYLGFSISDSWANKGGMDIIVCSDHQQPQLYVNNATDRTKYILNHAIRTEAKLHSLAFSFDANMSGSVKETTQLLRMNPALIRIADHISRKGQPHGLSLNKIHQYSDLDIGKNFFKIELVSENEQENYHCNLAATKKGECFIPATPNKEPHPFTADMVLKFG